MALVGLPILGVFLVLHTGARLRAPVMLRGMWEVQTIPGVKLATACAEGIPAAFTIQQSGPRLIIQGVASRPFEARIQANGIRSVLDCADSRTAISSTFLVRADLSIMQGALYLPECGCRPVLFRATRAAP